jgi:hypothetical protein
VTELARLVRRLRGYSPRAWQAAGRAELIRRLAAELVTVGGAGHRLPDVPDHALPDVIAVVGAEAAAVDPVATLRLVAAASKELS